MPSRCPNSVWVTNVLCRLNSFSPITLLWPPSKFGGLGSGSHRDGNLRVRFLQKPRKKKRLYLHKETFPAAFSLPFGDEWEWRQKRHHPPRPESGLQPGNTNNVRWILSSCTYLQHCCHKTLLSGGQPELWNKYVNHNQDIGCIPLVLSSGVHQSLVLGVAPIAFQLNPPKNESLATVLRLGLSRVTLNAFETLSWCRGT